MGIRKTALFLMMLTFLTAQAQQITEQSFSKEINGVAFNSMKLLHYAQSDGGIEAYFLMKRTGAMRSKMGPIWNGGGDPKAIYAVSALKFDHNLKLVETDLVYLEPEDAPIGKYELLKNPVQIGKTDVLATNETVVPRRKLAQHFPELAAKNDKTESADLKLPEEFYDNTLLYTNLGAKVKAFDERIYRYEEPKVDEEKSWFGRLMSESVEEESAFNHKLLNDKYNMETYRGASKDQWWIRRSGPFSDPISGNVIAHNYRYLKKKFAETDPKGFYEEVVTFDAAGKEMNRVEVEFEKPYTFAESWHFQKKSPEFDLKITDGVFLLYQGKPSKKNNTVTKAARRVYFVQPDGSLGWKHDFELTTEKMKLFNAQMTDNHVILMGVSWKPTTLHIHTLNENGLASHQTFSSEDPIYKAFGVTPINSSITFKEIKQIQGADASHTYVHSLRKIEGASSIQNPNAKPVTYDEGILFTQYDGTGKLKQATRISRSNTAAKTKTTGLKFLQETDNALSFLYFEPLNVTVNNEQVVQVALKSLKLNKTDLKIAGLEDKAPLLLNDTSFFVNEEEKAVYLFAEDVKKGELKLVKYLLKI